MKPLVLLLVMLSIAGISLATASARTHAAQTAICHRTTSKTNHYVKESVSGKALQAALKRPADIVPAPRTGCPKTLLTPSSGGRAFPVALTGTAETPAGDPVGTGTAEFHLRAGQGQVCYQLAAKNLPAAVAAHIHRGAAGVAGPVVIPLTTPNSDGNSRGCATVARPLVKAILAAPASYYANVHTAGFPAGAIRGQLTGTSTDAFGTIFAFDLKGSSEPNATGTAVLRILKDTATVCYRLHAANVTLPTVAAHIHKGDAGTNGPVVVPFTAPGADGNSSGCATSTPETVNDILANPPGFYVNVHTMEHPAGAIRAQLP
ncbi:MAG TPA: CHRD domain-containing protein [Candidatus Acidoferrum sp.]|nr:CHRD domain-containing protein [Candidatus Acidoferrum sp.]